MASSTSARDGTFRLTVIAQTSIAIAVDAPGYFWTEKLDVAQVDQTLDFVLERRLDAGPGDTVTSIVAGDLSRVTQHLYDGLYLCAGHPCKRILLKCCVPRLRVRLEWNDPSVELVLYLPNEAYYPATAYRYCCNSPIVASYSMNADFDVAFVALERKDGTLPSPEDAVAFTLHVEQDE